MPDDLTEPNYDDISSLARRLWEDEGRPEGKAEEHWRVAEEQLRDRQGFRQQGPAQPREGNAGRS